MKKIVLFLFVTVLVGASFVSYWIYQRYFRRTVSAPLAYRVERSDLKDLLHVRGDVAAEREYDLAFSSFGTVASVPVKEGQLVKTGDLLMRLETTDLQLQLKQLMAEERRARAAKESANARLTQAIAARDAASAQLEELKRGTRPEELQVSESKVNAAEVTLQDAKASLVVVLKDAYTKADDAVHDIADQLFQNPRSNEPQLAFIISDGALRRNVELERLGLDQLLATWKQMTDAISSATDLDQIGSTAKTNLQTLASFLGDLALAVNGAIPSTSVSSATISTWQTNMSLARTNVNLALTNLTDANATVRSAQTALTVAENEWRVLQAGTSAQQIEAQQAQVRQADANIAVYTSGISQAEADVQIAQAQIDQMHEKIRKASIYAPGPARVTKLWLKANEQYQQSLQGMPAISLATTGIKVQSDISEIDIPKIRERDGNPVALVFDAFPGRTYAGEVISVEPKEIIKDGDTYYRVNFQIDGDTDLLRRGMSADVTVLVAEKKQVLNVPAFMIREEVGKKYVTVLDSNGTSRQVEVQTGITDGEMVEIVSGLTEGQTLIASTE